MDPVAAVKAKEIEQEVAAVKAIKDKEIEQAVAAVKAIKDKEIEQEVAAVKAIKDKEIEEAVAAKEREIRYLMFLEERACIKKLGGRCADTIH